MSSATVRVNGIDLWFEELGDADGAPLLLIAGLGGQAISWPDEFCWGLVDRGFRVIRFDNRDSGLSHHVEATVDLAAAATAFLSGQPLPGPYALTDMAADAIGLLDALELPAAHVLGASMGGMIAQVMAINHPDRLSSLTSMMSSTGDPSFLSPDPVVLAHVVTPVGETLEELTAAALRWSELVGSDDHRDEDAVRAYVARAHARNPRRDGVARQLMAVVAAPNREPALAALSLPTLVLHGSQDRLIRPDAGRRTAELVPEAVFVELEGMGHDLPAYFWAPIIEHVTSLAVRSAS
ncbi:MAG: alpha/beta fold hydrolase [Acidimicrobiales bacterium]